MQKKYAACHATPPHTPPPPAPGPAKRAASAFEHRPQDVPAIVTPPCLFRTGPRRCARVGPPPPPFTFPAEDRPGRGAGRSFQTAGGRSCAAIIPRRPLVHHSGASGSGRPAHVRRHPAPRPTPGPSGGGPRPRRPRTLSGGRDFCSTQHRAGELVRSITLATHSSRGGGYRDITCHLTYVKTESVSWKTCRGRSW